MPLNAQMLELQDRLFDLILDKIEEVRYPSKEHMDRAEEMILDQRELANYVHVLLDKIERDRFPSLQMLDRVGALVRWGLA